VGAISFPSNNFNPYPNKYLLPGDTTCRFDEEAEECQGKAALKGSQASIVHALTYHGLPPNIDYLIDTLPSNEEITSLSSTQKDFLSFTVYSLKQMVAAGTVSAETAWSLFYWQLNSIERVEEDNYSGMRHAFMQEVYMRTAAEGREAVSKTPDLLLFEFYARAGEAGIAQFERYESWAEGLTSYTEPEGLKEDYAKALWLGMRITEGQYGYGAMNRDITQFDISCYNEGRYFSREEVIVWAGVDLEYNNSTASPIDFTMLGEMGHWMFDFAVLYNVELPYHEFTLMELPDRMSISAYTEAVNLAFDPNLPEELLYPELRVFRSGGVFTGSRMIELGEHEAIYPSYPCNYPLEVALDASEYTIAEYTEAKIRERIVKAVERGEIEPAAVHATYRKVGTYAMLLDVQETTWEEIIEKIDEFDLNQMEESMAKQEEIVCQALIDRWADAGEPERVKMLYIASELDLPEVIPLFFGGIGDESEVVGDLSCRFFDEKLIELHYSPSSKKRADAARLSLHYIPSRKGSERYNIFMAFVLIHKGEWKKVVRLGNDAVGGLMAACSDENPEVRAKSVDALKKINTPEALKALQMLRTNPFPDVRRSIKIFLQRGY